MGRNGVEDVSQELPTEPWLRLRFLGGCEVSLPEGTAHLETAKTRALLIYLSLNPGPQSRHTLMGLLWGDLPEVNARRNLRRALWNLRHQLAAPRLPPLLISDRETVCFNREFPCWSDVETFEAACSEMEAASLSSLSHSRLAALGRAIDLYSGEFLQGFYVNDAPVFEEWVVGEREQLRARALQALERLVESHAARGEVEVALEYARRLLTLEPWREETHRWLMRLLARSGQRTAALAQYETCRRILAQELGVEPGPETAALEEQIRAGALGAPAANLPAATTPFVGRNKELAEIADLLGRADCRLLTVTGLGGVGKTRLALEVARRQAPSFAHGVRHVELGALNSPDRIPAAVAHALNVPLLGTADPQAALLAYLREKRILILLDGFEHLLAGAPLLSQVLRAAPGIKLLVTSRERLNLHGEWVYALEGLACPANEREPDLASWDAVELFLQTARRVHLGFQVREGEQAHLVRICRLVAGLPLAIEMAAAWVRILSLAEIAAEIAHRLDLLVTSLRDLPAHHRSIRAVFERSWQLLSPEQQKAFARLAVFRGSFRPTEAQQVTGASLAILSALVDKSLLQRLPSGRYQLHELLRQYAGEQLERENGMKEQARDQHCQTYAALLAPYKQARDEGTPMPILKLIGQETENIRAAWEWAVAGRNSQALEAMYAGLADYFHLGTAFQEGEALFCRALEDLGWEDGKPPYQPATAKDKKLGGGGSMAARMRVRDAVQTTGEPGPLFSREEAEGLLPWRLLSSQASFAVYLGRFAPARASLERCLAVFARHDALDEMAHCQFFLGEIARFTGDNTTAATFFDQSLTNYRRAGNRSAIGFCLNGLGVTSLALGDLDRARSYLQESLVAFEAIEHDMGTAVASINLAELLTQMGDYGAAKEILAESFARCQKLGHRWGMATCLLRRGDLAKREDRSEEAKAAYEEALGILQDIGQRQAAAGCLIRLGQVCTDLGEQRAAAHYLEQALALATKLEERAETVEVAAALAILLARLGRRAKARQMAYQVARHPAAPPGAQAQMERLLADLGEADPPPDSGEGHSLEEVLAESMALLAAL